MNFDKPTILSNQPTAIRAKTVGAACEELLRSRGYRWKAGSAGLPRA